MEQGTCEVKGAIDNSMRAVVARIAVQSDSIDTVQRWLEEYPRDAIKELVMMGSRVTQQTRDVIEVHIMNLTDIILFTVTKLQLGDDREWALHILFNFLRGCLLDSASGKSGGAFLSVLNK